MRDISVVGGQEEAYKEVDGMAFLGGGRGGRMNQGWEAGKILFAIYYLYNLEEEKEKEKEH